MNNNTGCCRLDLPYPEISVSCKNLSYAALLSNDLAGQNGELSATTTYLFQHFIIDNEALANALDCISMVEMKHYGLISGLMVAFGGCPRLAVQNGCNLRYWSGQFVPCETNPARFLAVNIKNERAAIACYKERISQIDDTCARSVLERIILDEEHHIEIFTGFLEQYQKTCRN